MANKKTIKMSLSIIEIVELHADEKISEETAKDALDQFTKTDFVDALLEGEAYDDVDEDIDDTDEDEPVEPKKPVKKDDSDEVTGGDDDDDDDLLDE